MGLLPGSLTTGAIVVVLAVVFGLVSTRLPRTPQLDWDTIVLPLAQQYAGNTSSSKTPLQGTTIVITGTTNGLGLALTRTLSKLGGDVVALGRSATKLEQLRQEIPSVRTFQMDLADLSDVARVADEMVAALSETGIDILINNAGMHAGFDLFGSREGPFDRVFVVNYLSHFLLTEKLAPLLIQSKKPVLAQMSSSFHWAVDGSDLVPSIPGEAISSVSEDTMPIAARPGGSPGFLVMRAQRSYANSKLAQIYHARSLKNFLPGFANVRVVSVCPGWVATGIARDSSIFTFFTETFAFPMEGWGIASTLYALFHVDSSSTQSDASGVQKPNDWYTNCNIFRLSEILIPRETPMWMYSVLPLRDVLIGSAAMLGLFLQAPTAHVIASPSSPESYNQTRADELYRWSKHAVAQYL